MKSLSPMKQQGFTLIELVLVLGVIALIAIAAFIIYPAVQAGTQANTESSNVTAITACIKNIYGSTGIYSALTTALAVQAHCPPGTMVNNSFLPAQPINSTWATGVTITPGATAGFTTTTFDIVYAAVPTAACLKFVADVGSNFDKVVVGTSTVKDSLVANTPYDPALAITGCNSAASPQVTFTSK